MVVYDALAQMLGADLNFPAGPWTEIYYEASGTAEQTAYYGSGTLAFTPELTPGFDGLERFHPPYEYVVDQNLGTDFYEGSSIRAAYLTAFDAAVDPARHSVITGEAPRGIQLTISKRFQLDTSAVDGDGPVTSLPHELRSTSAGVGPVQLARNPSLRPSQYASAHLNESWTITCGPANSGVKRTVEVRVARGGTASADMSRCPRGPE